jgi:vitamin B12 transporter
MRIVSTAGLVLTSSLLVSLGLPPRSAAQGTPDTVSLPPVVVTATRLPVAPARVSAAVTVLSGAELRAAGLTSVADALRGVPGAAIVRSGSFGAQTSLFLRGGESDYTKVLIDGVAVNQPGGAFDFSALTTDNVRSIEVVRGPASVLYGSDAVTGVVQILTEAGREPGAPIGTAGVRGGTYGTLESFARLAGGSTRNGWSLAASRNVTDGILAYNNHSRTGTVDLQLRAAPDSRTDAKLSVRYDDHRFHFPTDGVGHLVDGNQSTGERGPTVGLDAGRFFSARLEGRLLLSAHHGEVDYDDPQDNPGDTLGFYNDFHSRDRIDRRGIDARANLHLGATAVLTGGAALESQRDHSTNVCSGQFGDCSSPPIDTGRTTRSAYTQLVAPLGARADLTAGARLDHSSRFGDVATYRGGLALRLGTATRLRASAGTGFKEPTFLENFSTGYVIGNPKLKDERTLSWEVGAEHSIAGGRVAGAVTLYAQRFRNLIDYLGAPPLPGGPNYYNVAAALANGVEAELSLRPSAAVRIGAGYTYLHTRVTRSGFDPAAGAALAVGQPLLRRPPHTARLDLTWRPARPVVLVGAANVVGRRWDQDFDSLPPLRVELPAYTRVDVAIRADLGRGPGGIPGIALSGRIENVGNARYAEARHFPAPRRTILFGAELAVGR